jgi:hypothetical protein
MNNITPLLNPAIITDETELTEEQLAALDLSKLPRKVRVRVRRPNAVIQFQHVGKKVIVTHLAEFVFAGMEPSYELDAITNEALSRAAWLLDYERQQNPLYPSVREGIIEVAIDHMCNGAQAMVAFDEAIGTLVNRANELVGVVAKGITFIPLNDLDWW